MTATPANTAFATIVVAGLIGAAAGWLVEQTAAWMLVGAVTGSGTAGMIALAGVRPVVAVPVGVGAGVGAYLGGTIVGVLCEPAGCPAFQAATSILTGVGALVGIGLVVALATRSFDEYHEGIARRERSASPADEESDSGE